MTIDEVLSKLESLHAASTGGEWFAICGALQVQKGIIADFCPSPVSGAKSAVEEIDNSVFSAFAHNLLPQVLAEIRRLRGPEFSYAGNGPIHPDRTDKTSFVSSVSSLPGGISENTGDRGTALDGYLYEFLAGRIEVIPLGHCANPLTYIAKEDGIYAELKIWTRIGDHITKRTDREPPERKRHPQS